MATDPIDFSGDAVEPGWRERLDAVRRAARALITTRAEIFREELAEKQSLLAKAAVGLSLAVAFAVLSLLLVTALVAAVLARLLGGPIAGVATALLLYLGITAAAAIFGARKLARVRPFDFPVTRDEIRKDLDAIKKEEAIQDEGPAGAQALAAEKASVRPAEDRDFDEEEEARASEEDLEQRFRAGSE